MAKKKEKLPQSKIKSGFNEATVTLQLEQIVPLKIVTPATRKSPKYLQILASIRAVGIIEPPVVARDPQNKSRYILLDGHLRVEALKEMEETEALCLVSTDDEAFTYNKHINRLSTVQEHKMILRAVEKGVPEEKIAQALNVDVKSIISKRDLLNGICSHAVELLKDKMVSASVFPILKRMKDLRQIEAATLMNDAGVYSASYAKALLAATPKDQLIDPGKPKNIKGLDEDQMARMESEMESLQREYRLIEENYGTDVLNLTLAKAWLAKLLDNARVVKYLAQNHAEFLAQFQKIAEMKSLNVKEAA
ncbi:MAG: plasmid partitioning protein RepB C-terminal domain-containing protein [Alphaproteobacteria bacterium]|nr:plasmid partitioning protein RepB C-terminal domain-containing protein [Alphaproteobacteria bacterium]